MSPNYADGMANSVDPDQTAPLGAVWSGSALFAQAYLSENLGSLRYTMLPSQHLVTTIKTSNGKMHPKSKRVFYIKEALLLIDYQGTVIYWMSPVKQICVFEHSVMTNFNCACPAIQRGQGSGFLSEGSSWLTACMSEQRRFWRDCADAQARLNLRCSHRR